MSKYYRDRHPMAAQRQEHTPPVCCKPALWKMSEEQAKRLGLKTQSENWEEDKC